MEVKDVNLSLFTPWRHVSEVEVELHLFLTWALDWSEWSSLCPGYFQPLDKTPVPTEFEVGCAPESAWTFGEDENLLPLTGFEPQIVHSVTVTAPTTLFRILKYSFYQGKRVFSFVIRRSLLQEGIIFCLTQKALIIPWPQTHIGILNEYASCRFSSLLSWGVQSASFISLFALSSYVLFGVLSDTLQYYRSIICTANRRN